MGDLVYGLDHVSPDSPEHAALLQQLTKHVSDLMITLDRAADFLKPIGI